MKMIFMGRKAYSAQLLEWTLEQGIEVVAVCTDNQFPNSPTAAKAQMLGIPVISMEEAEQMLIDGADVDLEDPSFLGVHFGDFVEDVGHVGDGFGLRQRLAGEGLLEDGLRVLLRDLQAVGDGDAVV